MDITELLSKKGQFVSFTTERQLKVKKNQTPITKISNFIARIGVDYDKMQSVKDKRESGDLPEENQGLSWGEWVKFPYLITHKNEFYLRCSTTKNSNQKGKVKYLRDGVEISKEEAKAASLASEFYDKGDQDVFNIKVSSIVEVK